MVSPRTKDTARRTILRRSTSWARPLFTASASNRSAIEAPTRPGPDTPARKASSSHVHNSAKNARLGAGWFSGYRRLAGGGRGAPSARQVLASPRLGHLFRNFRSGDRTFSGRVPLDELLEHQSFPKMGPAFTGLVGRSLLAWGCER